MKNLIMFALFFTLLNTVVSASENNLCPQCDSDFKVILSGKKIFVMADETPVKSLLVQVKNQAGLVVAEKLLSSKTADWSLDVAHLPTGEYAIYLGKNQTVRFKQ